MGRRNWNTDAVSRHLGSHVSTSGASVSAQAQGLRGRVRGGPHKNEILILMTSKAHPSVQKSTAFLLSNARFPILGLFDSLPSDGVVNVPQTHSHSSRSDVKPAILPFVFTNKVSCSGKL